MSQPQILGITLLGNFEVCVGNDAVPLSVWRHRRAAAIVKLLALEPTLALHREHLFDLLWPDLDIGNASNNLRGALHHARHALSAAGAAPATFLVRRGDDLVLGPPALLDIDVVRFRQAVTAAWQNAHPDTAEYALSMYTGDLLPEDLYEDWASSPRETLRTSYLTLLSRTAQLWKDQGDFAQSISLLTQFLDIEPHDEPVHRELIEAYGLLGNVAAAHSQFAHLERLLAQEFDATPEPATMRLMQAIEAGGVTALGVDRAAPTAKTTAPSPFSGASALQVPHPINAIVGREREITELQRLLRSTRLVTLIGPGGIGKTRLAIELGQRLMGNGSLPVLFVDLSSLRDASLVASTILAGFGVPESNESSAIDTLAGHIGKAHLLLILDNFEQVRPAAVLLSTLLSRCANLLLLVTSRARLQIHGERLYPVDTLELPVLHARARPSDSDAVPRTSAIELFVQRASEVQPAFALTPRNAATVSAICRKLDGLPLAIEIAAARIRFLTPQELLDRLQQPLAVLTRSEQDIPDRHRTMRDTIAWSVDLLSRDEQIFFAGLSVFAGGWSHEAAACVLGAANGDAFTMPIQMSTLLDQSLIATAQTVHDDSRFFMLETVREFATEHLERGADSQSRRQRHLDYFLDFAERARQELLGPHQRAWLDRLHTDHGNLRAAFSFALDTRQADVALRLSAALWRFWAQRGHLREGQSALERALSLDEKGGPEARAGALQHLGHIAVDMLDYDLAQRSYSQALEIWTSLGNQDGIAAARLGLGVIEVSLGNFEEARAHFLDALQRWRDIRESSSIARALYSLGELANREARYVEAAALLQESLAIREESGDETGQAYSWSEIGATHFFTGGFARAERAFAKSLALFTSLSDIGGQALVLYNQGRLAQAKGHAREAARCYGEALLLSIEIDDVQGIAQCLDGLAFVALAHNEPGLAGTLIGVANAIHRSVLSQITEFDRAAREAIKATVRQHLGDAHEETEAAGEDLSLTEAVTLALALIDHSAPAEGIAAIP